MARKSKDYKRESHESYLKQTAKARKQTNRLNLICMKWGDKYPPFYVNRLYQACKKYIQLDFDFYCVTDNSDGLCEDINILDIKKYSIPKGKWGGEVFTAEKVLILSDSVTFGANNLCILFDLDLLIHGDLTNYIKNLNPQKPLWVFNSWHDPERYAKNYGKITCNINASFIACKPQKMLPLKSMLFNRHYDYYALKFQSLDRTIGYVCRKLIDFHDDGIVYTYNFGANHEKNDIEPYIKRDDYKICLFNTSHGTGKELDEAEDWPKEEWESFDVAC